jgi:hypothetical protein
MISDRRFVNFVFSSKIKILCVQTVQLTKGEQFDYSFLFVTFYLDKTLIEVIIELIKFISNSIYVSADSDHMQTLISRKYQSFEG